MKTINILTTNNVTTVTLNRADVHNAFNPEMIAEITNVFKNPPKGTRVILLKGDGKSFCAGADLAWMKSMAKFSESENRADSEKLFEMFESIQDCPVPVVVKVHGSVYGGGLGLVAAADIVACVREAKFCFSEAKLGLVPAVISAFVLKKAKRNLARQMMLTAQVFEDKKAYEMGLLNFIGSEEEVDDFIQSQIDFLINNGPLALKDTKRLLNTVPDLDPAEVKKQTVKVIAERRVSAEGQEGLSSFFEKRKPNWRTPE